MIESIGNEQFMKIPNDKIIFSNVFFDLSGLWDALIVIVKQWTNTSKA